MNISGIVKSSLIDFPGLISCVLFVPGCNYFCFYCHNRSLIDGSHVLLTPHYITDFLQKRAGLLDAVVISGGEPTLQNDLIPFMQMVKRLGYQLKLDTNGSCPDIIEEMLRLRLCDYFAVDYKAPAEHYPEICGYGTDAGRVIKSIQLLSESDVPFEVRTTVIPQLGSEELITMAKEIPTVPRYVLNRYKIPGKYLPRDEERIRVKPYSPEEIQSLADCVTAWQPNVTL
ncbi:MAG TPA: anaerobic ribonucleoside-triphosphate reductase activating protein [Anaerovoracaceae bacterium]|nr:anaerobic ribonucleoside-triphosphate reductase activating protein [Anaerovoracaceae bacterium]